SSSFFLTRLARRPPLSPLFPYTTLFRSAISPVYGLETGLGAHLADRQRYALDAELVGRVISDFSEVTSNATAIRLLNGLKVSPRDRKSTRLNSSHVKISYAVFCLKKKKK